MKVGSNNPEVFSNNIRFLRRRKKLSRAKFAQYIDINLNQLYCIEVEVISHIHYKALNNLIEIYGISGNEILSEDLEKKYAGKRLPYSR